MESPLAMATALQQNDPLAQLRIDTWEKTTFQY
uniref:Uncharacterized protein n=1 Tax=Peronospora matthiolae TaxID=2874970 RepID=A0AAV1VPC4_9STRA